MEMIAGARYGRRAGPTSQSKHEVKAASAGALITPSEDDTLSQLLASMCKAGTKMSGVGCSGRGKRSYKGDPALTQVHNHILNLIANR